MNCTKSWLKVWPISGFLLQTHSKHHCTAAARVTNCFKFQSNYCAKSWPGFDKHAIRALIRCKIDWSLALNMSLWLVVIWKVRWLERINGLWSILHSNSILLDNRDEKKRIAREPLPFESWKKIKVQQIVSQLRIEEFYSQKKDIHQGWIEIINVSWFHQ